MMSEDLKGPQRSSISRRRKAIAIAIVIVVVSVVAIAYVIVLSHSSASVTLVVRHYDPQYGDPAIVALYINDRLKEEFSIDSGSNHTILFKLGLGNHTMGFDYATAPLAELDGVIDVEISVEITTSHSYKCLWPVGSSCLIDIM